MRARPTPTDLRASDPMERLIEQALLDAGIRFRPDRDGGNPTHLDFALPDFGIEIEVKRMHSSRVAEQMSRAPDVIVAQGERAVRFLAQAIAALAPKDLNRQDPA